MEHNRGLVLLVILLTMLVPQPAIAAASYNEEELLFSEIPSVIGASKYEQKVTEAPSSISIVTAAEIKKYGYRTLADILKSIRGFYVTYDRNYSYVGVRGFGPPGDYNSRILLLVDGHRMNDNTYDQALVGTEGILDVDLIDRVEVIRGPGSSLYGSNAFFAVVNMITKRGRDLKGTEVSGEAASYSTYKGRVSYGDKFSNGVEAIVSGSAYNSEGQNLFFPEHLGVNGGVANGADADRNRSFFTKMSHHDMTLSGAYVSRTKNIPTGAFGTDFGDPGNKTIDERAYLDLKYDHSLGSGTDVAARVYYDYYWYTGDYIYGGVLNKDLGYGDWWGGEVRLNKSFFDIHRVILGAEYQGNLRQDQRNYDVNPPAPYLDDKRRSLVMAAYVQDEVSLTKKMVLNAGVRYDHYSDFGGTTNPRLALIYNPMEKSAIKLLYGSAFRIPNDFERFYQSTVNLPNPALEPEKIKTYELVYEQYLGEGFRASVSGYYYDISNLISQSTAAPTFYRNLGEVTARGFELELDNKWANGLDGRISYTLQRAEDKTTGQPLSNSPSQLVKLNVTVPVIGEKLFASCEDQYVSRRRTEGGAYAGAFHVANVTLFSQHILDRFELSASAYNIFNKKYSDPVSKDLTPIDRVSQDGRNYRLKLTYAF